MGSQKHQLRFRDGRISVIQNPNSNFYEAFEIPQRKMKKKKKWTGICCATYLVQLHAYGSRFLFFFFLLFFYSHPTENNDYISHPLTPFFWLTVKTSLNFSRRCGTGTCNRLLKLHQLTHLYMKANKKKKIVKTLEKVTLKYRELK